MIRPSMNSLTRVTRLRNAFVILYKANGKYIVVLCVSSFVYCKLTVYDCKAVICSSFTHSSLRIGYFFAGCLLFNCTHLYWWEWH